MENDENASGNWNASGIGRGVGCRDEKVLDWTNPLVFLKHRFIFLQLANWKWMDDDFVRDVFLFHDTCIVEFEESGAASASRGFRCDLWKWELSENAITNRNREKIQRVREK